MNLTPPQRFHHLDRLDPDCKLNFYKWYYNDTYTHGKLIKLMANPDSVVTQDTNYHLKKVILLISKRSHGTPTFLFHLNLDATSILFVITFTTFAVPATFILVNF